MNHGFTRCNCVLKSFWFSKARMQILGLGPTGRDQTVNPVRSVFLWRWEVALTSYAATRSTEFTCLLLVAATTTLAMSHLHKLR